MKKHSLLLLVWISVLCCKSQEYSFVFEDIYPKDIEVGAERTNAYFPLIQGKKIALCANHTSMVGSAHLLDTLLSSGINVVQVFTPEHGFRGQSEAGEKVNNSIDEKTKTPIISLYGNNKKPTPEQMKGIDIVVFDIQDVGARFYTYISTLHYVMEAAAENNVKVLVLDRPNPNGFWVDGPVLDTAFRSFVGMHPVPIAHGMTVGEYAKMINGEGWLAGKKRCELAVVAVFGYAHLFRYQLPVNPSPNLSSMEAIYLYPSLCLFEGTPMSIGRGTDKPFRILGSPDFPEGNIIFTPKNIPGIAVNPPCAGKKCKGFDLSDMASVIMKPNNFININLIVEVYKEFPQKDKFFTPFFDKLAGTKTLREQIIAGKTAEEIKQSWQGDLEAFKQIRKKYLLYTDFE
jgi:uncharacterized protein YbbC (DUF1343 family)